MDWQSVMLAAAEVVGGLLVVWLVVVVAMLIARPKGGRLTEGMRLLPDLLRLLTRLGRDQTLPRGVRVRLGLLVAYLASPFDLVPDFIPVLGYADDVIVVVAVLRSVVRRVGVGPLRAHWPGTDDGFSALCRVSGLRPHPADQGEADRPLQSQARLGRRR